MGKNSHLDLVQVCCFTPKAVDKHTKFMHVIEIQVDRCGFPLSPSHRSGGRSSVMHLVSLPRVRYSTHHTPAGEARTFTPPATPAHCFPPHRVIAQLHPRCLMSKFQALKFFLQGHWGQSPY